MKLLNPLFDTVFKYLLEDLEVARTLIQVIIKKEVTELTPAPQEASDIELKIKYIQLGMIRQDYVAIIKTIDDNGTETYERVAIEVQKSPVFPEITRLRNYVSDKYRRKSLVNGEERFLTLKTIYLIEEVFNKNLPAVLGRRGNYYNELEDKPYHGDRDELVEVFNHDSWFIQTELLPQDFKDELLYILSVFAPCFRKSTSDRFIEIPDDDLLIKKHRILERIIRRLQAATQDNKINTAVDLEIDYENYIESKINEAERYKQLSEEERRQKEEAKVREDAAKQREEEAKQREEEAKQREEEIKNELAKTMLEYGVSIEKIMEKTGFSADKIRGLK